MDAAARVPGTDFRVGFDALLGLLPGAGDLIGAAASGFIVVTAARLGASPSILLRMLGNVAVDALLGTVPFLGDLFDVGWKANLRNVRLLEQHLEEPEVALRGSRMRVAATVAAVLGIVGAIGAVVLWAAWRFWPTAG